jgi:predicted metalloendopeptidase
MNMSVLENEEDRGFISRTPQQAYDDIIKYANAQRRGVCGTGIITKKVINPSTDFFSYVNRGWIRSKRLKPGQEYIVQIDNFRLAQDAVYNQLTEIVNSASTPAVIKNLYASLKTPLSSSAVLKHVNEFAAFLDTCIAHNNLWKLLAYLNTNETTRYACPISWDVLADEKNSKTFISHITYPELSLYDYRYYVTMKRTNKGTVKRSELTKNKTLRVHFQKKYKEPASYQQEVLNTYVRYINKIFKAVGMEKELSGEHVLKIEKMIIRHMACYNNSSRKQNEFDNENEYEKLTLKQLETETRLDWQKVAQHLGYAKPSPSDKIVCSSTGYLKCMMRSLLAGHAQADKSHDDDADDVDDADDADDADDGDANDAGTTSRGWKSAKWRSYWIYIYARHVIQYHAEWSKDIHFAFCMKYLRGQAAPLPQRIVALYGTTYAYDSFFAHEYKRRYFNADQIKYAEDVARDIRKAAKDMVRANTWVSKSTRLEALRKLESLKITIGLPEKLGPDIPATVSARFKTQDGWTNLMDVFKWRTQVAMRNEGHAEYDMPQIDWAQMKFVGSQAYVVNAYYTETRNSVYIPLGYFQTGFVDLTHGPEYNLARIGYTLGHEIGHCLHVYGRIFDHTGNMRSWWTPRDSAIYNRKLSNVERQYELAARRDGLEFDAKLSLSEDLADITGLKLCEMVLNAHHERDKMLTPLRMVSFEKFYTEFANQNRQKIYRRSIFAQLKSNPHPLDKYRTNIPLSRMALFNKIYNIKPGDKMHWQTEDTVW